MAAMTNAAFLAPCSRDAESRWPAIGRMIAFLALTFAALVAQVVPSTAHAQDPRAAEAQRAARQWLAAADRLDARATWGAAGSRFRKALTLERWTAALKKEREPRGAVVQRALASTSFRSSLSRIAASGDFVVLLFHTSFAQRSGAGEQVTLEREADGVWRVVAYVIR